MPLFFWKFICEDLKLGYGKCREAIRLISSVKSENSFGFKSTFKNKFQENLVAKAPPFILQHDWLWFVSVINI